MNFFSISSKICFWLVFSFLILYSSFSIPASAQTADLRLTTSPLPINLVTEPGHPVSSPIRIRNEGTQKETLKVELLKFRASGDTGIPELLDPDPSDESLSFVSFSDTTFDIAPNEWKTITLTVTPPETASLGYYYAVTFSRADDHNKEESTQQTKLTGGTAVLVLLEVKVPNAKREVSITSFESNKKWYEFLPTTFTVKLKNTGNVHVAPRGNLFIGRPGKKADSTIEVNLGKGNILPDSSRSFRADWAEGFPIYTETQENGQTVLDEHGNIVKELTWNWKDASNLRFGKYQAKLLMVYDDGKRDVPIEGVVEFWVMPWRLILFGIALPVVPALFVYFLMKRKMRKLKMGQV